MEKFRIRQFGLDLDRKAAFGGQGFDKGGCRCLGNDGSLDCGPTGTKSRASVKSYNRSHVRGLLGLRSSSGKE